MYSSLDFVTDELSFLIDYRFWLANVVLFCHVTLVSNGINISFFVVAFVVGLAINEVAKNSKNQQNVGKR